MRRPSWIQRIIAILLIGGLYVFMAWTFANGAENTSPLEVVKNTIGALKKAVGNKAEIRRLILERVDFYEMGHRSMGRNWKNLSEAQRKEYLEVFEEYAEVFNRKSVFESIEFINSVNFKYKERLDGDFSEVDVEATLPDGNRVYFLLRLHVKNNQWKAYDFVIENVSIVGNWRAQFDRIIAKEKFPGLLRRLREKIKELDK